MMSKSFEPLHEFSRSSRGIEPVEVIASQFRVWGAGLKYLKRDYQNFVACGDNRFGPSSSALNAVEESPHIALFAV